MGSASVDINRKPQLPSIAEMSKGRKFYASEDFIVSCGCVTLDPAARKVLLVFNKKLDIYQLPKGRKSIGEDLLAAALREAHEESGVRVQPLPLKVGTRATPLHGETGTSDVTRDTENCEPCAITHSRDPYSGAFKHVFYFVAVADSTVPAEEGTQEDWEKFDTRWTDADVAPGLLAFKEDGMVVQKALDDARRSGVDI
jgi:8-oxo-dGTP pyrophosphatase MutT (NUDIX family)